VSFALMTHLLPVLPKKGVKRPRLSWAAVDSMFFVDLHDVSASLL